MILETILTPDDLKKLSIEELQQLTCEVRERIMEVLSVNGGHLASNLGSVELTLALHTIFDSPTDKFIFDVSHQAYTHKLVTGRNDERFDAIRKSKGLNGFTHPEESEHDHFFAGHAGTALSLGLGMARARDLAGSEEHIVPIIGDATLTCGLSLEALNNIPADLRKFVVILNDNAMSISHNVGGITNILSRLVSNPTVSKWKREFETVISKIPFRGNSLAKLGHKLTESIKNLVSTAPFFEQFGLSYIGPVDGHDLRKLLPLFSAIKELEMPVILHLYTKKGQGVELAEKNPIAYHGVKPFDLKTCEFLPTPSPKPTFPKVFGKEIVRLATENPSLVAVTPAMSLGSCLESFKKEFPKRFFDVGIAEGHAVTFAGGLGKTGTQKVICSIYSTFLHRALDNLFHDVCLQKIPVIFTIDRAGLAMGDGATHHGIYEISFLKAMPNMVICCPRNGQLLAELLQASLSWNLPTAIRYPNIATQEANEPFQERTLGKAEVLANGKDLLILSLGHMCTHALRLREKLLEKGIEATIVDPIYVKPLDKELLGELLLNHKRVVTLEEHSLKGGFGQEVNAFVAEAGFHSTQILNLGIPEIYLDQGSYDDLLEQTGLSIEQILGRITRHFSFAKLATAGNLG